MDQQITIALIFICSFVFAFGLRTFTLGLLAYLKERKQKSCPVTE